MRAILLLSAALLLPLVALAPTASAGTYCAFDTWTFHVDYDCEVQGVGGSGTIHWCPDPFFCLEDHIIGCYFDLSPPWLCYI